MRHQWSSRLNALLTYRACCQDTLAHGRLLMDMLCSNMWKFPGLRMTTFDHVLACLRLPLC
eukprot:1992321-Amphidinium_carterae.1